MQQMQSVSLKSEPCLEMTADHLTWRRRLSEAVAMEACRERRDRFDGLARDLLRLYGNKRRVKVVIQACLSDYTSDLRQRAMALLFQAVHQVLRVQTSVSLSVVDHSWELFLAKTSLAGWSKGRRRVMGRYCQSPAQRFSLDTVALLEATDKVDPAVVQHALGNVPLRVEDFARVYSWRAAKWWACQTLLSHHGPLWNAACDAVMLHLAVAVGSGNRQVLRFSIQRLLMTLPLPAEWMGKFETLVSRFMIAYFKVILRGNKMNEVGACGKEPPRKRKPKPKRQTSSSRMARPCGD